MPRKSKVVDVETIQEVNEVNNQEQEQSVLIELGHK